MEGIGLVITASSILFGFFFTGFRWSLNRELSFKEEERHFKYGLVLLLFSMGLLAFFGIALPLRTAVESSPLLERSYWGIILTLVGVFGYMLTELAHYSVFQRQRYATWAEHVLFWLTVAILVAVVLWKLW